jgi:phosphatidylethanolamine-binding protein (PEBP) family uncharacterized protein
LPMTIISRAQRLDCSPVYRCSRKRMPFINCVCLSIAALFAATLMGGCATDSAHSAAPVVRHKAASSKKGAGGSAASSRPAAAAAQASAGSTPAPFIVTSPAFKDGDVWPSKFAGSDPSRTNPPCPGDNISPPLVWSNAPNATKSFAIFMFDPDGNNGLGVAHWVAYDIPPQKTSLSEGEASDAPRAWVGGKNVIGSDRYFGPCGPAGHALQPISRRVRSHQG